MLDRYRFLRMLGLLLAGLASTIATPAARASDRGTTTPISAEPVRTTLEESIREALDRMPGTTAMVFTRLTSEGPVVQCGIDADGRFAVGSSFKLYILGTLIDEINAGQRLAENVERLRAEWIGPPQSELAGWPLNSPVTLHTLALKMISISDNTATDHLLFTLGRQRVEQQLSTMGHRHPAWNTPLLSTREMVLLRNRATDLPAQTYQHLDVAAKRAFLAEHCAGPADYDALDFDTSAFALAEWYATPLDMARALAWIHANTQPGQPAAELRAILAVDPKLQYDPATWTFVGFKGGSEDRLLAGNWLLQHAGGDWYTLHTFCNSPQQDISPAEFAPVVEQILHAIESTLK